MWLEASSSSYSLVRLLCLDEQYNDRPTLGFPENHIVDWPGLAWPGLVRSVDSLHSVTYPNRVQAAASIAAAGLVTGLTLLAGWTGMDGRAGLNFQALHKSLVSKCLCLSPVQGVGSSQPKPCPSPDMEGGVSLATPSTCIPLSWLFAHM